MILKRNEFLNILVMPFFLFGCSSNRIRKVSDPQDQGQVAQSETPAEVTQKVQAEVRAEVQSGPTKSCMHDEKTFRCVKYIKNYDADTVTFEIPDVHPLLGKKISIRVSGVDTPELRTKNNCEKKLGEFARDQVSKLLLDAKRIDLKNIQRGKYFRIVADVVIDGKSLTDYLIRSKMAYRYDGGKKSNINWCERLPASLR